jgi:hypothetical protein
MASRHLKNFFRNARRSIAGRPNKRAIRKGQKMDMRKFSGGSYVKVPNVQDGPIQGQIAVVKEGNFGKPSLVFETGEMLGVNATNNKILMRAYGADSDGWIGKEVELFLGELEYQGQQQPTVMVRPISPPTQKPGRRAKSEASKSAQPDLDDEIPF